LIVTEGEVNPPFHEVVKEIEGDKDVGTIANVIKRGYTLNGKVLRPAKVAVFKAKSKPTETAEPKVEESKES
jgi:molecular chaperone GrpE (heat shock protein)